MTENITRAYVVLGVAPGASQKEIKGAYRALVRRWHPDRYAMNPTDHQEATRRMVALNAAYLLLRDRGHPNQVSSSGPSLEGRDNDEWRGGRLPPSRVQEIVAAVRRRQSYGEEWSDPYNRLALGIAATWVLAVAAVSWWGPKTEFDPVVGRALAPVSALSLGSLLVGLIWFGTSFYRAVGWLFLLFFIFMMPMLRMIMSRPAG